MIFVFEIEAQLWAIAGCYQPVIAEQKKEEPIGSELCRYRWAQSFVLLV
jgi:hypothetical protein